MKEERSALVNQVRNQLACRCVNTAQGVVRGERIEENLVVSPAPTQLYQRTPRTGSQNKIRVRGKVAEAGHCSVESDIPREQAEKKNAMIQDLQYNFSIQR